MNSPAPRTVRANATNQVAEMYVSARRPEQAIEVAKKALEMEHGFLRLRLMLMSGYLGAGMTDDAIREAQSCRTRKDEPRYFRCP